MMRAYCVFAFLATLAGSTVLVAAYKTRDKRLPRVYVAAPPEPRLVSSCLDWLRILVSTPNEAVVELVGGNDTVSVAQCSSANCTACYAQYGAPQPPLVHTYTRWPRVLRVTRAGRSPASWAHVRELAARNDSVCHSCHIVERLSVWLFTGHY